MSKKILLLFLFYFCFSFLSVSSSKRSYHPIHLSITDVEHNPKDQSLEIVHKVFIDDLEKILENTYRTRLYLATDKEHADTDKFIIAYLKKHFTLEIDGRVYVPEFHGKFVNAKEDIFAVWILAKIEGIAQIKTIKHSNTILMDLYDDQENFTHFKYLGKRKSARFKYQEKIDEISF
jgi:hypothetical protein